MNSKTCARFSKSKRCTTSSTCHTKANPKGWTIGTGKLPTAPRRLSSSCSRPVCWEL
jgi:hypothetical protein